jgi:hypothetical protein
MRPASFFEAQLNAIKPQGDRGWWGVVTEVGGFVEWWLCFKVTQASVIYIHAEEERQDFMDF